MNVVLGDAGRAALKAFFAAVVVVAVGISQATNLNDAYAVGVAALVAGVAAAAAALQAWVPLLSFRAYVADPFGPMLDAFVHASLGAFLVSATGWLNAPDYSTWHSFIIAAIVGALSAGLRAVQGFLTPGERPAPVVGVRQHLAKGLEAQPLLAPRSVTRHLLPA